MMKLDIIRPGRVEYGEALELQYELLAKRQEGEIPDTLVLLEHPPVITMGRRGAGTDILVSESFLEKNGVAVEKINRGGEVTYHGPGQITGYTIISLDGPNRDIERFIYNLEEVFVRLLDKEYGIKTERDPDHRGVWIGRNKIAAIGIAIRRRTSMHGFAFNVNTNLDHFKWIIPCGLSDRGATSLEKETGHKMDFNHLNDLAAKYFCEVLGYQYE